jgi:hypothetical protein
MLVYFLLLCVQLAEAAEAHEASAASLKARVEYYQHAATEASKDAEDKRHK